MLLLDALPSVHHSRLPAGVEGWSSERLLFDPEDWISTPTFLPHRTSRLTHSLRAAARCCMPSGVVYVLLNPSMPGLVKIGRTKRSAEERARRLRTTGVPSEFMVIYDVFVDDAAAVEQAIHQRLRQARVEGREFFRVSPKEAVRTLIEVAQPFARAAPTNGREVEVLDYLRSSFGDIFHGDLEAVALAFSGNTVMLRGTRRTSPLDRTMLETDLGIIVGGADEEPVFSVARSIEENVDALVTLDELTLVMCTPIVREEEAYRIDREQNPYWTETRLAADDRRDAE